MPGWWRQGKADPRERQVRSVIKFAKNKVGDEERLANGRRAPRHSSEHLHGQAFKAKTEGRLVAGTGRSHPIERSASPGTTRSASLPARPPASKGIVKEWPGWLGQMDEETSKWIGGIVGVQEKAGAVVSPRCAADRRSGSPPRDDPALRRLLPGSRAARPRPVTGRARRRSRSSPSPRGRSSCSRWRRLTLNTRIFAAKRSLGCRTHSRTLAPVPRPRPATGGLPISGRFDGNAHRHPFLQLVSPALLAGADQTAAESCELRVLMLARPAPLVVADVTRGLARRGNVAGVGSDGVGLDRGGKPGAPEPDVGRAPSAKLFDHKDGSKPKPDFKKAHGLAQPPTNNKITQGLSTSPMAWTTCHGRWPEGEPRHHLEPGGRWELRMAIGRRDHAALIAATRRAAVYLLCRFGGVGSKAQGFGSFADYDGAWDLDKCRELAAKL